MLESSRYLPSLQPADCKCYFHTRQVLAPPTALLKLPALRVVDLRGMHKEKMPGKALGYWSEDKCISMRCVTAFIKALRRRPYPTRVLCCED